MDIYSGQIFTIIWIGWIVSWLAAAFWSAPTEKRGARAEAWIYRTVMLVGSILLWPQTGRAFNEDRLWLVGYGGAYALAALAFAGLVFTWWARIHLGRLWSGTITRKQDHRIVETGPYALVRPPIYTGLIAAIIAPAIAEATVAAIVGAVLAAFGLWLKARIEERFLAEELGADAYDAYRRRVPMLVPFLRPRGS